ncbi:DNA mismatch repair endonuclease MutH [Candidatus Curculioniphilus buchneri]|uniref:DNA mismatch repair endonuclease MutH n=1 Tax=Candidatus Curculioniphilus buchneri TaxID=690594 RepID=UPI00376EA742
MYIPHTSSFSVYSPSCEHELLRLANALSGYTLGELSANVGLIPPNKLKYNKGWIGTLLERCLGASAGNKPEKDFAAIGVELKTIPVKYNSRRPLESTFVCVAPLIGNTGITWKNSYVCYKLEKVLWIPIEGQNNIPLIVRRVGIPLLWSPNEDEEQQLRCDWEELMNFIVLGKVEHITACYGEVLQLRPKATNGRALTVAIGEFGQTILTLPRGFYLKKHFTAKLLERCSLS